MDSGSDESKGGITGIHRSKEERWRCLGGTLVDGNCTNKFGVK